LHLSPAHHTSGKTFTKSFFYKLGRDLPGCFPSCHSIGEREEQVGYHRSDILSAENVF
jgi:hypothetical protein